MKVSARVVIFLIAGLLFAPSVHGATTRNVQGTVVEVQKHRLQFPGYTMGGSNPSDAPLTSRYYVFEVSIRVGCETYVGRYQTPFNFLPSLFTPDQRIEVRLTKHVMYFELPYSGGIRMSIVHRHRECGDKR